MITLLIGSALLSIFHALIPSHWLPILAIGRKEGWPPAKTLWVTFLAASAHVLSTILVGIILSAIGGVMTKTLTFFTEWLSPILLISLGVFYLYQHYYHHHFHLHKQAGNYGLIASLALAMFLSPCFEIEGYFLAAGQYGWGFTGLLALVYGVTTIIGMMVWMQLALHGLKRLDWHAWEHYSGLIAGAVLVLSGIVSIYD